MEDFKHCEVCGKPYSELHHIIYRSQAKYLQNVPINFIYLCATHHRGNKSPHGNKKIDLELKKELQVKLKNKFTHDYYTLEKIKEILGISRKEAESIVKTLRLSKEGYKNVDIIQRCLGGKFYDTFD